MHHFVTSFIKGFKQGFKEGYERQRNKANWKKATVNSAEIINNLFK